MRIGLYVSVDGRTPLERLLARFARAEADGFHTAWTGQLFDHDALTLLALAGRETGNIELGSWVLPVQTRHPGALAQQALTAQAASGGRLLLGIGVSHEAVIAGRYGLGWEPPVATLRAALEALRPLLAGEGSGALRLSFEGLPPPPIFAAALGPRMLHLAGAHADGVALWLMGPRALEAFALPRVRESARRTGRAVPRVACGLPVALTRDRRAAHASAEQFLGRSARLPAYRRVLEREGASSPADVGIYGEEQDLRRGLARLAALGVSDFTAVLFPVTGDPEARSRTQRFLGGLAREASQSPRGVSSSDTEFMQ